MKNIFSAMLLFVSMFFSNYIFAQAVRPSDVNVSMGLVPVYELSSVGGCPYLLAAPSPQWYILSYRQCPSDEPTFITEVNDKIYINEFMQRICRANIELRNNCQAELIVEFPDMTPVYN
jgi:hypothetical protein